MEQRVEDCAIAHAFYICRRIAIEAVLSDVEKVTAQILVAEVCQIPNVAVEVKVLDGISKIEIQMEKLVKHITLQLGHIRQIGNALFLAEPVKRAQKISEGVAQLAILVLSLIPI